MLTACEQLPTYRYRLTVDVETPEGLRRGTTVVEVRTQNNASFPGPEAGGIRTKVRGEAVAVDLGKRGMLFALLRSEGDVDNAGGIAPSSLLPDLVNKRGTGEAWATNLRKMKSVKGAATVPLAARPMLVRFRDIAEPTSVELVKPEKLDEAFGSGVRLRQITIRMTDDAVTMTIESKLKWLHQLQGGYLDGGSTARGSPYGLYGGDFSREMFK